MSDIDETTTIGPQQALGMPAADYRKITIRITSYPVSYAMAYNRCPMIANGHIFEGGVDVWSWSIHLIDGAFYVDIYTLARIGSTEGYAVKKCGPFTGLQEAITRCVLRWASDPECRRPDFEPMPEWKGITWREPRAGEPCVPIVFDGFNS